MMKNNILQLLVFCLTLSCATALTGQGLQGFTFWQTTHSSPHYDAYSDGVETTDGAIAMIGNLNIKDKKEEIRHAFLKVVYTKEKDQEVKKKFVRHFKHQYGNGLNAIVTTPYGDFLLAGYVLSSKDRKGNNLGKTEAWIIKVDSWGNKIWETTLSHPSKKGDGMFRDLAMLDRSGNEFIAVGEYAKKTWTVKFDSDGNVTENKIWPKTNSVANAVVVNNNSIAITGRERSKPFFKILDKNLNPRKTTVKFDARIQGEAIDLLFHEGERTYFLLCASQKTSQKNKEFQLLKLLSNGSTSKWVTVATINEKSTALTSLTEVMDGQLWAGGYSSVLPKDEIDKGSKFMNPIYLSFAKKDSMTYLQEAELVQEYSNKGDRIHRLFPTIDGGMVFLGEKNSNDGGKDAWMIKVRPKNLLSPDDRIQVQVDSLAFIGQRSNDDTLRYKEHAHLHVNLSGDNEKKVFGLRAVIQLSNPINGLHCNLRVVLRPLKRNRGRQTFEIPIHADAELFSDQTFAKVAIYDAYEKLIHVSKDSVQIITQSGPSPWLKIVQHDFLPSEMDSLPKRGDTISVNIRVKNFGEKTAKDVVIAVKVPYMVKVVGDHFLSIDSLPPGQVENRTFRFIVHPLFLYDYIPVQCMTYEQNKLYIDYKSISRKITSYFSMPTPNGERYYLEPTEWMKKYHGGPSADIEFDLKIRNDPIEWGYETFNQKLTTKGEKVYRKYIALKAIIHDENIQAKNIIIMNNGQKVKPEKWESGIGQSNGKKFYIFEMLLDVDENEIQLMDKRNEHLFSEKIKLTFERPNIYFFGIGVKYDGVPNDWYLETSRWTKHMRLLLQTQKGGELYNKVVNKMLLTSKDSTSKAFIEKTLLNFRPTNGGNHSFHIENHDVIVFYMAGHGLGPGESSKFLFVPSGTIAKPGLQEEDQLIPFKYILGNLNAYACETLVLIDACQSGRAVEDYKDIQQKTTLGEKRTKYFYELVSPQAGPTINIVASSRPTSNSYHLNFSKNIAIAFSGEAKKVKFRDEKGGRLVTYHRPATKTKYLSLKQLAEFCQGLYNILKKNELLYHNEKLNRFPFFEINDK